MEREVKLFVDDNPSREEVRWVAEAIVPWGRGDWIELTRYGRNPESALDGIKDAVSLYRLGRRGNG